MTLKESYENLILKFSSGNEINVERATITKEEWEPIEIILSYIINKKKG